MGAQASGKASTVNSASGKAKRLQSANAATDKSQLSTPSIPATSDKKTSGQRKIRPLYKLNDQAPSGLKKSESGQGPTSNKSNNKVTGGPQTSESGKTQTTKKSNNKATNGPQTSESGKTHTTTKSNNNGTTHTSNKSSNQATAGTRRKCLASTTNQPNIASANVTPSTHAAIHSSIHDDHCYTDVVSPKKRKIDPTDLPTNVAAILPPEYEYKRIEFEDLPEQMQHSFKVRFCVKDITCKEEVDNWLSKLAISSNIKYNTESGGRTRSGKRVSFARWYICQCKRKKLTKKQEAAKRKAQEKKQLQKQSHPMNTEPQKLDLLSNNRDKKTDCESKMSIKIFTKRTSKEMCEVELWWNHNHSVNSFHLQSFCPILPSTKAAFENYFESGMSASEAFHHHEKNLMQDSISVMLLADRKYCPSLTDVNYMYGKWQLHKKGAPMGRACLKLLQQP